MFGWRPMNQDFDIITDKLTEELALLENLGHQRDSEVVRRLYVRSAFAFVEAFGCILREKALHALLAQAGKGGPIPVTKIGFLDDGSYALTDTGQIQRKDRSPHPFGPHFAFTLRTLAEVAQVSEDYIHGPGWDAFKRAIKIRNRITHPKTAHDVMISDGDYGTVHEGLKWAFNSCIDIISRSPVMKSDKPVPPKMP